MNQIINRLTMERFKCFKKLQVHFGALTVLCGFNGSGKSTVVQPILLLAQSLRRQQKFSNLLGWKWHLNGDLVRLGTCGDVLYEDATESTLKFRFDFSESSHLSIEFLAEDSHRSLTCGTHETREVSDTTLDSIANLTYVCAKREGTLENHPFPDEFEYSNVDVGYDGRFASFWYNEMEDQEIESSRCSPGDWSRKFRTQLDAWLNQLVPGARVTVAANKENSVLALRFQLADLGKWKKPANVGYGLTYVFPILVSLLSAKTNDLIIIDSPEAHLHPQAQSRLGQMLSLFASTGIQIVVETHSDHILNGIRLGVKKGKLEPKDLSILFFSGCSEGRHGVISPSIDKTGRTSEWPKGFFDQMDMDLLEIFG